ncbi:hypothetical protein MAR_003533 [Mya arenaria]|uniref:Uncharacterized protein n=1 Tax=Mya arenaria TaxID=6604 RepID=A0ABY7G6B4_MYAAR|nr:hypothetical protein MAR_003533 [Mya arenaria]
MIHLLEKTQYEIYEDFKNKYPYIEMSLCRFENCKQYFVRSVRPKMNTVFKSCRRYRKEILHEQYSGDSQVHVYERAKENVIRVVNTSSNFFQKKWTHQEDQKVKWIIMKKMRNVHEYLKSLMDTLSFHEHKAQRQHDHCKHLIANLPLKAHYGSKCTSTYNRSTMTAPPCTRLRMDAVQNKSRYYLGVISRFDEFGYRQFNRSYVDTSHGKCW